MSNLSFVRSVGDGTNRQFLLSNAGTNIGYFRTSDIHAYVDDVEVTFTINAASPHIAVLDEAPALGADVLLRREMPVTAPYANFERGNNFGHRQVNNTFVQQLYLTQEMLDGFAPDGYYMKQELDMGFHKVINLLPADADGDAVEFKQWYDKNVVQDGRIQDLEQSLAQGNLIYRRVVFTATEGQTEFNPNARFGAILNLYINGVNQIAGEAYENVDGSIIRTMPLDEGDRVVAIIGQEPQFQEPEQTDFRYVRYPYFATGGELSYMLPADAEQVLSVFINGIHQTSGEAYSFDKVSNVVTYAEALEGGDSVVIYAGSEPAVEGDASNLPVTTTDGSWTATLRTIAQRVLDIFNFSEINVKSYGAKGDGLTNDTVAITAASDKAHATGKSLYFPAGHYLMTKPLELSTHTYGDGYKVTKVEFIEGFTNPEPDAGLEKRYMAVYNRNYLRDYDADTADKFDLHKIHFHMSQVDSEPRTAAVYGTSNTDGVNVYHCKITSEGKADGTLTAGARTSMSFYDGNKNMNIYNNCIEDNINKAAGGCIWLQGGSGRTDETKSSSNIRIWGNLFKQKRPYDGDECIGLYGAGGILRDVDVYNNTLILEGGGQGISVFATANNAETFSKLYNVNIRNNTLITDLQYNSIRIGGQNLPEMIENVSVTGNVIYMKTPNASSSYGIRATETAKGVRIEGNAVVNVGTVKISRGISGWSPDQQTKATGNYVIGSFQYGIQNCFTCQDNIIDGADFGTDNCVDVRNNYLWDIKTYIFRATSSWSYVFADNRANMTNGTYAVYTTSAFTGTLSVRDNDIILDDAATRAGLYQGSGEVVMQDNKFYGTGRTPAGVMQRASGNYYFDVWDDYAPDTSKHGDLRLALPIGHVVQNSAPVVDGNSNLLDGWSLDTARAWQPRYIKTVSA
ncbi:hypothetical protein PODOV006v2_p0049 [Vibrio phage 15E36.1]|uniref:Rhamnogalacturonase A/B/Epimerase-like pectate lyase domain-containing protein n=1 Tax=Vibrio phage 15E36.1 TaxID=2859290 RepID=A0AAE8C4R0_9CAUD|nr:hypothetical protein PODOV006v2_p0049 [Vibrio phage 15E36.1]